MTESGKARDLGKTDGFIKVVIDPEADEILGAAAVCEQGSELVQLVVELMNADATVAMVRDAIHIHPTLAEAAKNAVLAAWFTLIRITASQLARFLSGRRCLALLVLSVFWLDREDLGAPLRSMPS